MTTLLTPRVLGHLGNLHQSEGRTRGSAMMRLVHPFVPVVSVLEVGALALMLARCDGGSSFTWSPLLNAGFEDVLGSDPTHAQYWLGGAGLDGDEIVVTDAGKAHGGTRYLQVQSDAARGESEEGSVQLPTVDDNDEVDVVWWPVRSGLTVQFGGWAYRETGNLPLRFTLSFHGPHGEWLPFATQATPDVMTAAWTLREQTITVPEGAGSMAFVPEVFNTDPPAPGPIHTVG